MDASSNHGMAPWLPRRNDGWVYADVVDSGAQGWTVLELYARRYPHSSEAAWRSRLEQGLIRRHGEPVASDERLRAGDRLQYRRPAWTEPPAPRDFGLVWDDEDLLAVDKPSGLQVLPAAEFLDNTLLSVVRERRAGDPAPIHRLGRGTSGIVLFARSREARRGLAHDFHNRGLRKVYRALAQGLDMEDRFAVDMPIGRVAYPGLGYVYAAAADGKASQSVVRVVERRPGADAALVEVEIPTGRPHQIRIHLAAAGHPLVDEPLYQTGGLPRQATSGRLPRPGDTGYHLHAMQIDCRHPVSHARMSFYCQPPARLRRGG